MTVLRGPWIQRRDTELWIDPSPLTNHRGVWVWSISGQFVAITQGSVCTSPLLPPLIFTPQHPRTMPRQPSSICPTFNPIIWVRDSAAVIFIEFPITSPRLQLSAGDWSLRLSVAGAVVGPVGCWDGAKVGGREVIGWFLHSARENVGQQSSHL